MLALRAPARQINNLPRRLAALGATPERRASDRALGRPAAPGPAARRPMPRPPHAKPPTSSAAADDLLATLKAATRTPAYRGPLQIAVFLIVFMVFDAAWSGDWSRIGAISKETEAWLKPVSGVIGAVHLASAGVAWTAVSGRGGEPLVPVVKALAVGVLAAVEAVWAED